MSLSKGHLGSWRREASKNKLKDTSFIFPMTNVTILGVFRKVWKMMSTHILNILALLLFKTSNAFTQSLV